MRCWLIILAVLQGLAPLAAGAADANADAPSLQAAMVYNLLAFAEWPAGALPSPSEFTLCLLSDNDEVIHAFTRMAGKPLKGRPLAVARRQPLASLADCQAVYFDRIDAGLLADKVGTLRERPVLTLAADGGERSGAMIGLRPNRQRLGFAVDTAALRLAGISLPARVLELAKAVYR